MLNGTVLLNMPFHLAHFYPKKIQKNLKKFKRKTVFNKTYDVTRNDEEYNN